LVGPKGKKGTLFFGLQGSKNKLPGFVVEKTLPEVSVVLVSRNTRALTLEAVRSVFQTAESLRVEVILVDNGSSDKTMEAMQEEFPQVRCCRSPRNLGFARAANLGAREAQGKYLLFLNSDAYLFPGSLSQALFWMEKLPRCGVAGGQLYHGDGRPQNSVAAFPSVATELLWKPLLRRMFPEKYPGKETRPRQPSPVDSVVGAFFLVRRSLWEKLGGFDERFFFFLEETDFCRRAWQAGHAVYYFPDVRVGHRQGATARQGETAARIEYWRSRYLYFSLHGRPWERALLRAALPVRLLLECLLDSLALLCTAGALPSARRRAAVHWGVLLWHLRGCPEKEGLSRD
jgi:GT2 family glycosyltransferase